MIRSSPIPSSGTVPPPERRLLAHELQELWFTFSKMNWGSVVLVPADEGGSTIDIATSLASIGRGLRDGAVTLITMSQPVDYVAATQLVPVPAEQAREGPAPERVIIAIQPVIIEPLGLAIAKAADAVILCIEIGKTRLSAARRTIELVGRQRISGSMLLT